MSVAHSRMVLGELADQNDPNRRTKPPQRYAVKGGYKAYCNNRTKLDRPKEERLPVLHDGFRASVSFTIGKSTTSLPLALAGSLISFETCLTYEGNVRS